jgi:hypothetical protein
MAELRPVRPWARERPKDWRVLWLYGGPKRFDVGGCVDNPLSAGELALAGLEGRRSTGLTLKQALDLGNKWEAWHLGQSPHLAKKAGQRRRRRP